MENDAQYLRLLSIFHYIVGGMVALFGCFPIFHFAFGVAILVGAFGSSTRNPPPPPIVGLLLMGFAGAFICAAWTFAVCLVIAGRMIASRKGYWYCFVIACIECCFTPFGTVLGVFTIIVLLRPSVESLFGVGQRPPTVETQ